MAEALTPSALDVLRRSTVERNRLKLPPEQMDRPLYEEVDEVLKRLRGKWKGGRTKAHVFPYDPAPLISGVLATGEMPPKNPTAFFPTPAPVIERLFDLASVAGVRPGARVLEPSAGTGALALALAKLSDERDADCGLDEGAAWTMDLCEIEPFNRAMLEARIEGDDRLRLVAGDFLTFEPEAPYDLIVMNPPFSVTGDKAAWITHTERAWGMLAGGGTLAAIVPGGFLYRSDRRSAAFRDLVAERGAFEQVEAGAFSESGTGIPTVLLALWKDEPWKRRAYNGFPSWHSWATALFLDNDRVHLVEVERLTPERFEEDVRRFAVTMPKDDGPLVNLDEADIAALAEHYEIALPMKEPPTAPAPPPLKLVVNEAPSLFGDEELKEAA